MNNFPDAPPPVLAVAEAIIAGQVPDPAVLATIAPEDLNRSWSAVLPDSDPEIGHTLLRQAVMSRNVPAVEDLLAAGADPFFNANEMAFRVIRMSDPAAPARWFPDYRTGNTLLALWIAAKGDVNATGRPSFATGTLLADTGDNLEAALMLLAAGADPWRRVLVDTTSGGTEIYSDSFAHLHANANLQSSEIAFRGALVGAYRNGPPDQVERLIFLYDRTAAQYVGSTGPENLHIIWGMQMALRPILEQTGAAPTPAIARLLDTPIPPDVGGFWLARDEVRSPPDPDQLVRDDNQTGTERWND
jgi:hypothetical protein